MRRSIRTLTIAAFALGAALGAGSALWAGDDDDDDDGDAAAAKKTAEEALAKAVTTGKTLFSSKDLGKKSCASCHNNPEKPNLDLSTRAYSYPAFSRRAKVVVTMQQKINEMLVAQARGKALDPNGTDIAAIEAYIVSVRKK